jgi:hypothetical protein
MKQQRCRKHTMPFFFCQIGVVTAAEWLLHQDNYTTDLSAPVGKFLPNPAGFCPAGLLRN